MRSLRTVLPLLLAALALSGCAHTGAQDAAAKLPDVDGCAGSQLRPSPANAPEVRAATLCLINAERARAGEGALTVNPLLTRAAEAHSLDMAQRKFFEHRNPDGVEAEARIVQSGYPPLHIGENLAWGETYLSTPASVMKHWMESPGHKANILQGAYREIGIGLAYQAPEPQDEPVPAAIYTTDFGAGGR